ncbi:MAG: UvrD-helicase domain-containing protein [Bacteroidales bacterium]|nr:UvrD-helicase domain-containing protein [Bacteroidales bacterium]
MFKVYKASAGAGKTTRLVIEYLSLCFKEPKNFRHILAITFTNNATAEMKARIVNTLYRLAFTPFESLSNSEKLTFCEVQKAASLSAEQMPAVASDILRIILYDYSDFSVSTIDSFFQRILRSFAFELGLNMNFNVQVSLDEFYEQTVDTLLNRLSAANKDVSWRVLNVVEQSMSETGRWNIERELLNFLPVIYAEESYLPMQQLEKFGLEFSLKDCYESFRAKRDKLKAQVLEAAKKGNDAIGGRPCTDFAYKNSGVFSFFDKIIANPYVVPAHVNVTKSMDKGSFTVTPDPALFAVLSDCVNIIEKVGSELYETVQILKTFRILLLLLDMKSIMDEIKLRDNLFYLSETNTKIYSEIKEEDTPYIYEKIGNKYAFFFIDEFQDTSKFQWNNMMPLVRNALAQQAPFSKQHNETGSVILFGDVKQSIYRFRNGDASLLNTLSSREGVDNMLYNGRSSISESDYKVENLDFNFRSCENVINFNNNFFSFLKDNPEKFPLAARYYGDLWQKIPDHTLENRRDGFVAVSFDDGNTDDYMCTKIYSAVQDALQRGYSYGDIAVLSRGRAQSSLIACELTRRGVPVISNESLLLSSSDKVNLIMAVVRYINSADDNLAKFMIIDSLVKNKRLDKSLEDILQMTGGENPFKESNFVGLLEQAGVAFNRTVVRNYPLFSAIADICRSFSVNEDDVFVATFMDYALEQMPSGDMSVLEFIDWWERNSGKLSVPAANGINAVTINTVHSAKGLEYPVLIFPMLMYRSGGGKNFLWCDNPDYREGDSKMPLFLLENKKDLVGTCYEKYYTVEAEFTTLDVLNIIYVALTRASDCMYIITGNPEKLSNFAKLLFAFIGSGKLDFKQDEEKNCYWYGNMEWKNGKRVAKDEVSAGDSDKASLFNSDFTIGNLVFTVEEQTPEQVAGIYVHDFLASLKTFPQNEEELLAAESTAHAVYRDRVGQALRKICGDPELAPYFKPDVRCLNEVSIASPSNSEGKIEVYRPDRVVFFENSVTVIDYKTGKYHESYEQQLQQYCVLLEQMGYQNVDYKIVLV